MNAIAEPRHFAEMQFTQMETRFDAEFGVLWGFMKPTPRPTFNATLLAEARDFAASISGSRGRAFHNGQHHKINYVVEASKVPGIYNLGGDLALFREAIANQDRQKLLDYGRSCIDNVYGWATAFDQPLTTIALVQGDAMGGGFESALAASVLVAEESARLGFPEILFNLFPGMGAYSLLSRKVGRRTTEEMIHSGNLYTGRQLYDMGVVDVLATDGAGELAVFNYIKKHAKAANGRRAIEAASREVSPVTHDELSRVVEIWVDAALRLGERDIRMMERLVRAQSKGAELELVSSNVTPLQRTA
ncbi:MAG: crotonase/enoyl-CoA hydratase family protein [Casimicrobiaceae bacterium]